uniref:Uncharacterized protein n=1 Tax=Arundo donax TaxID=35708 RepID=A0A0A9L0H2_ARUDO
MLAAAASRACTHTIPPPRLAAQIHR